MALFGVLFAIEKYHKNSWYLFVAASICLIGAAAISYFRNSSTPPEKKDSLTIKADTSKIQSQRRLTKPNIPPYVDAEIINFSFQKDTFVVINLDIQNVRELPAFHVSQDALFKNVPISDIDSIKVMNTINRHLYEGFTLFQKKTYHAQLIFSLPKNSFPPRPSWHIIGVVGYYDEFGTRHLTMYCSILDSSKSYFYPYPKYNWAY